MMMRTVLSVWKAKSISISSVLGGVALLVGLGAGLSATAGTAASPKLGGAELYAVHCSRCHAERYPTERTATQWKTLLLHMRVRANLPESEAKEILKYMQENSGK